MKKHLLSLLLLFFLTGCFSPRASRLGYFPLEGTQEKKFEYHYWLTIGDGYMHKINSYYKALSPNEITTLFDEPQAIIDNYSVYFMGFDDMAEKSLSSKTVMCVNDNLPSSEILKRHLKISTLWQPFVRAMGIILSPLLFFAGFGAGIVLRENPVAFGGLVAGGTITYRADSYDKEAGALFLVKEQPHFGMDVQHYAAVRRFVCLPKGTPLELKVKDKNGDHLITVAPYK